MLLTLETTCDETAAAVVNESCEVLSSVVASQEHLHQRFGGVVPEIASRAHLERILPIIDEALCRANVTLCELHAVAVANTPGLAGSLLVGLVAAKALCVAQKIPLIAIDHLQAHIYACQLTRKENVFPCVGLVVSGGHTSLYRCRNPLEFGLLGGTIDDAAGEAFDKIASLLGLPFPGGPAIERAARDGDPTAFTFPRSFVHEPERLEFSFSGLKTAVRYALLRELGHPTTLAMLPSTVYPLPVSLIANLAASFQEAVVDCLVAKAVAAIKLEQVATLCVGGGVASNSHFRNRLTAETQALGVQLVIPPREFCTDNAAMGAIAWERYRAGLFESLNLDTFPGLVRTRR